MARHVLPGTVGVLRSFIRLLELKVIAAIAMGGLFALQAAHAQMQPMGGVKPKPADQSELPPAPSGNSITTGNGIEYHGGPVMLSPHNIYFIWYGNWSGSIATTILPGFITGLNGSNYFNTNTTYGDANNDIANTITMAGQFFDNYSLGPNLGSAGVGPVVSNDLTSGKLPVDANGIYLVLTSPDVKEGNFCTSYCGYHTRQTINGTEI